MGPEGRKKKKSGVESVGARWSREESGSITRGFRLKGKRVWKTKKKNTPKEGICGEKSGEKKFLT